MLGSCGSKCHPPAIKTAAPADTAPKILLGWARGLHYLKQSNVIHCDLSSIHASSVIISHPETDETGTIAIAAGTEAVDIGGARIDTRGVLIDFSRTTICCEKTESNHCKKSEACNSGFALQMFQFGTLLYNLCAPPETYKELANNDALFAQNNGPCYPRKGTVIANILKAWDSSEAAPLIKNGFSLCSKNNSVVEQALKDVATAAFNPILTANNTAVDWIPIISKLDGLVHQLKKKRDTVGDANHKMLTSADARHKRHRHRHRQQQQQQQQQQQ